MTSEPNLPNTGPSDADADTGRSLRWVAAAGEQVLDAEIELNAAVEASRRSGDSWSEIGAALDVSAEAAVQRFAWPERSP